VLHRVLALVLAAATIAAPLSLVVCRVECAGAADREQPAHHSCHESSDPAAVSMTAVPHACGLSDGVPAGLEDAYQPLAAPVAVMPVTVWMPSLSSTHHAPVAVFDTSPPLTNRPTQLRV
jgi:hypothetical protein